MQIVNNKVIGGVKSILRLHGDKPASINKPVEITTDNLFPLENQSLIDWFAFTVLDTTDPFEALKRFRLDDIDFQPCLHGGMGYKQSLRCGNIVVFYDGSENMGVHISMTGQGCRQFESLKDGVTGWYRLFCLIMASDSVQMTRIDLAVDNVDGQLDLNLLDEALKSHHFRSRFKTGHKIEQFSLTDNPCNGKTIYLGSPASKIKVRFYDKAAELGLTPEQCNHWVRAELQLMGERSQQALTILMQGVEVGFLFSTVLNNYFSVIHLDDSNKTRCTLQDWWRLWLETTEKQKLTVIKATKVIEQVMQHLEKNYSPTFAMLLKALGVVRFNDFIHNLLDTGIPRLKQKHYDIIQNSILTGEADEYPF